MTDQTITTEMVNMYQKLGISSEVLLYCEDVLNTLKNRFEEFEQKAEYNQLKVIRAMQDEQVNATHFSSSSGYGYDDAGRETLEKVYANVFHTEDALVRPQITCGTHALALALFSNLRPGDELLSISGKPYDTLEEVIGIRESLGSLKEYGITYAQVDLLPDGSFDREGIKNAINEKTKMIAIQRSKGYQTRKTLSPYEIGDIIRFVKEINQYLIVMVDNCYGEFVECHEPSDFGADMTVGSLIKNPGGGLAPVGGYIVGTKKCIENAAYRLTAPGLGKEVGASLGILQSFYQGLFMAPSVVCGALKGAVFAANIYERLGFKVVPDRNEPRYDIIQAIEFGMPEGVIEFCKGIQAAAPVDSYVTPEPWAMPGYDSDVIMAAGAFVQGSSIELSADGPIKPPYAVYFQGGLTWYHAKLGIINSLQKLVDAGIVKL
ncbi:MAG: methionine gamma-lyase family protein [Lachnospiraceae bacterium]|nr:methionine gamma-lyase family protein [Lachnospiraceae bacterium]